MNGHIKILVLSSIFLSQSVTIANTLISGDIGVASNWDDGVLPTDSMDPGIIDSSNTGANQGTISNGPYSNLAVLQTGGDVVRSGFGNSIFDTVSWEITGGTFTSTSLGHQMNTGSVLDIGGGTASFASLTSRASTVNITSGNLSTNNDLSSQGGAIFNFSGGTTTIGRDAMRGFQPTTTFNFSGNADFDVIRNFGEIDLGVRSVNLLAGSGSVTVGGDLEVDGMAIDWASGSGYTITFSSILDNGVATTWEDVWNAGQLTVNGGQTGTFNDNFVIVGDTLSLIPVPEPSVYGLAIGIAALGFCLRRRVG